jgi:Uma2 family endonuclease
MSQRAGLPAKERISRPRQVTIPLVMPPGLRVSERAFGKLCQANPDLRMERTARGVLEVMPPASGDTGRRNGWLTAQVVLWAMDDGSGAAFDSSTGFTLPNRAIRSPDASWILDGRWNALTAEQREVGFAPISPDFVVELRSNSDSKEKLRQKMREYIEQGVRLGWLIDPLDGTVEIYRAGRPVEILEKPATLSGEDVLPGFVLKLKGILRP